MVFQPFFPTRRLALAGLAGLAGSLVLGRPAAAVTEPAVRALKPGQFTWQPELQPRGPVSIIVSIREQLLHVHRRGTRIGASTVSTGKPGHETPLGVFTILQKRVDHVSNIYEGAEMPFMQRLTWTGIALHAGKLPGYPASAGCVRMPLKFAEALYGVTRLGTPVVIAEAFTMPAPVFNPNVIGQLYSGEALATIERRARRERDAEPEPRPVTSVLVSRADGKAIVLENGEIVAEGAVRIDRPEEPFASTVFVLAGAGGDDDGLMWEAIGYGAGDDGEVRVPQAAVLDRIQGPESVAAAIRERLAPGMLLILTDTGLAADTRSDTDFVVMTAEGEETP